MADNRIVQHVEENVRQDKQLNFDVIDGMMEQGHVHSDSNFQHNLTRSLEEKGLLPQFAIEALNNAETTVRSVVGDNGQLDRGKIENAMGQGALSPSMRLAANALLDRWTQIDTDGKPGIGVEDLVNWAGKTIRGVAEELARGPQNGESGRNGPERRFQPLPYPPASEGGEGNERRTEGRRQEQPDDFKKFEDWMKTLPDKLRNLTDWKQLWNSLNGREGNPQQRPNRGGETGYFPGGGDEYWIGGSKDFGEGGGWRPDNGNGQPGRGDEGGNRRPLPVRDEGGGEDYLMPILDPEEPDERRPPELEPDRGDGRKPPELEPDKGSRPPGKDGDKDDDEEPEIETVSPIMPPGIGRLDDEDDGTDPVMPEIDENGNIKIKDDNVDKRTWEKTDLPNGGVQYKYKGELNDRNTRDGNDDETDFEATVIKDKDGNVVRTETSYKPPKDLVFTGIGTDHESEEVDPTKNHFVEIKGVRQVVSERNADGTYTSKVVADNGTFTFTVEKTGHVSEVRDKDGKLVLNPIGN